MLQTITPSHLISLRPWLDSLCDQVEVPTYIESDPVSFLHAFENKEDQLLAGFFAAIMAWGRRDIVLSKVSDLLSRMDHQPELFIRNFNETAASKLQGFKHRTFTDEDVYWLVLILHRILGSFGGFESFWSHCYSISKKEERHLMDVFHQKFFEMAPECPKRTKKHIADRRKKSSCKRLYLYLRWTIRSDSPVDLGLMKFMSPDELYLPLDVHVARQARRLGLLGRIQNDWQAVEELTDRLREINPRDPARYDYALFGIGVLKLQVPDNYILNLDVD